jgi:hypothetical protein
MRLWCCWWWDIIGHVLGVWHFELDKVLLYDWLGNGSDVIVEEEIVGACCLRKRVYGGVVVRGLVGRSDGLNCVSDDGRQSKGVGSPLTSVEGSD